MEQARIIQAEKENHEEEVARLMKERSVLVEEKEQNQKDSQERVKDFDNILQNMNTVKSLNKNL